MKFFKFILSILFFLLFKNTFSQSMGQQQWSKIRDEAFLKFIQNGGTTEQWQYNSDKIVEDYYNRTYNYNNAGQVERKKNYVTGTILSSTGVEGYFYNNVVMNSGQQTLGYFKNGYFLTYSGECVGFVNNNKICACDGSTIAYLNGDGFYNYRGYLLWRIQGENLLSNNQVQIKIVGLNLYSLAAFYLFIVN